MSGTLSGSKEMTVSTAKLAWALGEHVERACKN